MKQGIFYNRPEKYKYSLAFSNSKVYSVASFEKDKYLSLANLDNLRKFIPNIDLEKNIDLLPFATDAFVANRFNKNFDGVATEEALLIADLFPNKFADVEHRRNELIGVILTSSFSEFGSNKPIKREDLTKDYTKPFNVTLGGVIWRIIDNDFASLIEDSNDPNSEIFQQISSSWELCFSDYDLVVIKGNSKNIEDGERITDEVKKQELSKYLFSEGGNGKKDDNTYVYRLPIKDVLPLAIGFTTSPAADVKGIAVKQDTSISSLSSSSSCSNSSISPSIKDTTTDLEKNNKSISQLEKQDVKTFETIKADMKITNLKDITDENLKQVSASTLTNFFEEELKKASEAWTTEKNRKDVEIRAAQEKLTSLSADFEKTKKELETSLTSANTELAKVKEQILAREKQEKYNERMAKLDSIYDLSDEDRAVIASEVKDVNDEDFKKVEAKYAVLLKEKNKEVKKKATLEASASVLGNAIDKGEKETSKIPNAMSGGKQTMKERWASLKDGIEVIVK